MAGILSVVVPYTCQFLRYCFSIDFFHHIDERDMEDVFQEMIALHFLGMKKVEKWVAVYLYYFLSLNINA
jgi:hypothetical protein